MDVYTAPTLLLFTGDGRDATALSGKGWPLGITDDAEYPAAAADFSPGDMLLLYTDGATEVCDANGRMLDPEGLVEIVGDVRGQQGTLESVYLGAKEYCGSVVMPDDFTVLSVTREA